MNPFLGQIIIFGGNFAPRGWAFCQGQLLPIAQNTALFSILGTTYGGDGRTTFGLPDLRGRVAISEGRGPGLSSYRLGERTGSEYNILAIANIPAHNHVVSSIPVSIDVAGESAGFLGAANTYAEDKTADTYYPANNTGSTGGGTAVNNLQPYLAINYIVALQGTFPSRS